MPNEVWEIICTDYDSSVETYRLKVPGGWLYRVSSSDGITLCFVPDPELIII